MTRVDRRPPNRGDERRAALLTALDEFLKEGMSLDDINIAQLSERAGVTRSAFYFYFENKPMAMLALTEWLYEEVDGATDQVLDTHLDPTKRIHATITSLFDTVDRQPHAYRALLEAKAASAAVRASWARGLAEYSAEIAAMITAERVAGRALEGAPAQALATVLLDLNDREIERYALSEVADRAQHIDALTSVWVSTIYGTGDAR